MNSYAKPAAPWKLTVTAVLLLVFASCGEEAPRGVELIFADNGQLHLLDVESGAVTQLTSDGGWAPDWSPDGRRVAYVRYYESASIRVMNVDDGDRFELTAQSDYQPRWSPDGERIAFISKRTGQHELFVCDADGGNPIQLTEGGAEDHRWSPDGEWIVFSASHEEIRLVRPDGSVQKRLTAGETGSYLSNPIWRPDGSELLYHSGHSGARRYHLIEPDGTNERELVICSVNAFGLWLDSCVWRPTGESLAFVLNGDIWVMDTDGENANQLTTEGGFSPAWSPDGARIAFVSERTGDAQIYIIDADGGNERRLTELGGCRPVWRSGY